MPHFDADALMPLRQPLTRLLFHAAADAAALRVYYADAYAI